MDSKTNKIGGGERAETPEKTNDGRKKEDKLCECLTLSLLIFFPAIPLNTNTGREAVMYWEKKTVECR